MFTKAEEALIQELTEQKAPLERWAKFFPQHRIVDLMEKPKPLYHYCGKPFYSYNSAHFNSCNEFPVHPEAYAAAMKKGNIYLWDDMQDAYLVLLANKSYSINSIIGCIKLKFGIERTSGAINSRLFHLGYTMP